MFERKIPLFTLFGFKISIDPTWFVLVVLITWSLAKSTFPHYFAGLSNATYWWMGVAGALGLFVSIIFHEFCHSLVARHFNLPVKGRKNNGPQPKSPISLNHAPRETPFHQRLIP